MNVVPEHLGALHPFEQLVVLLIAFGPFLVLGVVVYVVRRRDIAREDADLSETTVARTTTGSDRSGERD